MKINPERMKTNPKKIHSVKPKNDKWDLRLYVAGKNTKTATAFDNLKIICEEQLKGNYQIQVIDILKQPQIARDEQIVAIPTLVRQLPLPVRNIIGDLSNRSSVLRGLGLNQDILLPV